VPIDPHSLRHELAAYPPWFVAVCAVIAGVFLLWLAGKVLKWSVMVIAAILFILGGAALVWLVWR
jgi:uncharacterized membrane protein YjjP (DUF1212 family)